jgi:hypothetical protein
LDRISDWYGGGFIADFDVVPDPSYVRRQQSAYGGQTMKHFIFGVLAGAVGAYFREEIIAVASWAYHKVAGK